MADRRKLAQGLMMMTPAMREDLAGREQDIQRGKTVELLRRAGKEMYGNPIVNTAIGFTPGVGDVQAAGETVAALQRGAPWQETAGYAVGMLPFVPMIGKTVWHGSPHTFDKFDMSKIGTGEGAQAYGHGLYLAEAQDVAQQYQKDLTKGGDLIGGKPINQLYEKIQRQADALPAQQAEIEYEKLGFLEDLMQQSDANAALKRLDNEDLLPWAEEITKKWQPGGSLYKVDLPDEQIAKMLDWDKPLSEQPKGFAQLVEEVAQHENFDPFEHLSVAQAVGKHPRNPSLQDFNPSAEYLLNDISDIYGINRNAPETSSLLQQRGIPGIQYLDQASRGAGEGTRNYVVFSDEIPQILERNGQPVAQALRNYEAPKQTTLQDVVAPIEQRGVTLDVYESNKKPLMTLSRIEVPKEMRGQGVGTQAMQDLVNYANQQGKTIALSPSTDFGGTSVNRLKDFYKQFGFVENKGRNKDFEISESMYRLPETE